MVGGASLLLAEDLMGSHLNYKPHKEESHEIKSRNVN